MFRKTSVIKVCVISFVSDCLLAFIKLFFGSLANSAALVSDGFHSCADALTSFLTLVGISAGSFSLKKEKAEKLTTRFICLALLITGGTMFFSSLRAVFSVSSCPPVNALASIVSLVSVLIKELLFRYSRYASKITGSDVLYAQAWHHRSDVLSCVGSFIGIIGSSFGFPVLDKAVGILISIMIIRVAVSLMMKSFKKQ